MLAACAHTAACIGYHQNKATHSTVAHRSRLEAWFAANPSQYFVTGDQSCRRWIDIRGYDRRVMQYIGVLYDLHQVRRKAIATARVSFRVGTIHSLLFMAGKAGDDLACQLSQS